MKQIAVLGSTGSIGTQTLEVVRANEDMQIVTLAAGSNIDLLEKQIVEFTPKLVCVYLEDKAKELQERLHLRKDAAADTEIVTGMDGLIACATYSEATIVVAAVVGMIGIRPVIEAIKSGKDIAFANKETLVTAGHIIMPLVEKHGVKLLPVDSEHAAIFQCLQGEEHGSLHKILLTASGGPFRGKKKEELEHIRVEDALRHPNKEVTVALVGKYTALHDAYISVVEALKHGGIAERATVNIKWVDSEDVTTENVDEILSDVSGILVPGGFGSRGVEGMILAAKYAREHQIPYLGLCLGMQVAIIEYARHVCGFNDAHSIELDPNTTHPVIALMPDQNGIEDIGGTLRLGSYPCILDKTSKAYEVYGAEEIHERHRHRYEVNNDFRASLTESGMKLCGTSPDGRIVEMIEIPEHPWFVATQAHPELKSRPNRPHPLFKGFVEASIRCSEK